MSTSTTLALGFASLLLVGCGASPPPSQVPDARAALHRLHATQDCGAGIQAAAKIDHFGEQGRVRGDLLMFAVWPAKLRMDVIGPMNVGVVATLTSDGEKFSLADLREKRFFYGPAKACNIARLTTVPMPGHVLVSLLRGQAPVLKHEPPQASIAWRSGGFYEIRIASTRNAEETIHIAPHPADFGLPWQQQRMRLLDVEVKQQGLVVYHAALDDHKPTAMAVPRVDPEGIDPPLPVSGPVCTAELPRRIHVEVPGKDEDVQFRYENVTWNPPLVENLFAQPEVPGLQVQRVTCDED
ncbi:MAG: hypothetical protein KF819_30745 [Labilithrix sp.]|nr:hypothetical protein [Labilithrix sp.]